MTRSRSLDRLRKLKRTVTAGAHPIDDSSTYESKEWDEPDSQTDRQSIQCLVEGAFKQLSPSQGMTLRLALFEELSHREIAQRLNMPLGTVKSHCKRGLAKLKAQLHELDRFLLE